MTRVSRPRSRRWRLQAALALALILALPDFAFGAAPQGASGPTVDSLLVAAREFLERRTSALVEGAVPAPLLGPLASNAARASTSVMAHEKAATDELAARRDALSQVGVAYTSAKTVLTLQRATVTQDQIDLLVAETTALTFKKVRGDEPDFTAFVTEREFRFGPGRGRLGSCLPTPDEP